MILTGSKLDQELNYIKGVGPVRAELLQEQLGISTIGDYLLAFPFRYEDRSTFHLIKDIRNNGISVQLNGTIYDKQIIKGKNGRKRLVAQFRDSSGFIELVWFKSIKWVEKNIIPGEEYIVHGKVNVYKGNKSIPHPELERKEEWKSKSIRSFVPVYSSTERLNNAGIDNRVRRKISNEIVSMLSPNDIKENLPSYLLKQLKLPSRYDAIMQLHGPTDIQSVEMAQRRVKFEELFFFQIRLLQNKEWRKTQLKGHEFSVIGDFFNTFYHEKLPFELTGAQKRVIKEIRHDMGNGIHMNRLLQGDVGSGKTIVALLCMLIAMDNGYQACIMAPTEILAQQHYQSITSYVKGMGVNVGFLSGTVKGKKRKELLKLLEEGAIHILIGTHALIEDPVVFNNLGLAITDEQHRFGVKQRGKLWQKSKEFPPHILVMTATPIPRTLAMTLYGDLDISVIDELPPGRKEIVTVHRNEAHKGRVWEFLKKEIAKGRQIYIVYPLIEESESLDLQNLENGYERLLEYFPRPQYQISVVHGKMKPDDKDFEMDRFAKGLTDILVATTVIEVGVNVPNASVMVIENAERFGLSQLHQLRGRVGRGAEQSFCILSTGYKLSKEAKERLHTMVSTNDGFKIAEADLKLRGPGSIDGTQQSGLVEMALVNLAEDRKILETARFLATKIIDTDPEFNLPVHQTMKKYVQTLGKIHRAWGKIS